MLGWIIVILLCIGALYQWRHTDFVKAILVTLKWGVSSIAILFFVFCVWVLMQHLPQSHQQPVFYPTVAPR